MRLERGDEPAAGIRGARRCERRADFGGMVRVVVDHLHTARFAEPLEAPLDAAERREPRRHVAERHAERAAARERGERVEHVVTPRHAEANFACLPAVVHRRERRAAIRQRARRARRAARPARRCRSE